ncbi:MAG: HD domain-containing protein [Saprospiraceae bacterium]|nr:HD domain-containing protein [Saprospiraceae bacterium]
MIDFDAIKKNVLIRLENNLSPVYTYHDASHTLYVLDKTIMLCQKESIKEGDTTLLKIAALYHDIGFLKDRIEHEKHGCTFARNELSYFGLMPEEIEVVCGMIMATKVPQSPKNNLEMILADADLEYLSTNQFDRISEKLYTELKHFNPELDRKSWLEIQIDFISKHHYHTDWCKRFREFRKIKNLGNVREVLKALEDKSAKGERQNQF